MRRRGLASPDDADALACTFAFPVQPSDHTGTIASTIGHKKTGFESDYRPYASAYNVAKPEPASTSRSEAWMPGKLR